LIGFGHPESTFSVEKKSLEFMPSHDEEFSFPSSEDDTPAGSHLLLPPYSFAPLNVIVPFSIIQMDTSLIALMLRRKTSNLNHFYLPFLKKLFHQT